MIIDWNVAPDWAIGHAIHATTMGVKEVWVGEDRYQQFDHSRSFPYGGTIGADSYHNPRRKQFAFETLRPAPWNGEGPPPVGVLIEMKYKAATAEWANPGFHSVTLAWVGIETFVTSDEKFGSLCDVLFRPIRTPEQIAAEERELEIIEIERVALSGGTFKTMAEALYDAGYRKQVKP